MKINRIWEMPNKWTFQIPTVKQILQKYNVGKGWVDPFAGECSPAEITNDLNPDRPTKFHMHALEFCKQLQGEYNGCLFDPPYSLRQVKECYDQIGIQALSMDDTNYFPNNVKEEIAHKIIPGGIVICFGWNSLGFGLNLNFEMLEIFLIPHGGKHNDTIVTVEQKSDQQSLFN
jgi:hypothetical protein